MIVSLKSGADALVGNYRASAVTPQRHPTVDGADPIAPQPYSTIDAQEIRGHDSGKISHQIAKNMRFLNHKDRGHPRPAADWVIPSPIL